MSDDAIQLLDIAADRRTITACLSKSALGQVQTRSAAQEKLDFTLPNDVGIHVVLEEGNLVLTRLDSQAFTEDDLGQLIEKAVEEFGISKGWRDQVRERYIGTGSHRALP